MQTIKMSSRVLALKFNKGGQYLFVGGSDMLLCVLHPAEVSHDDIAYLNVRMVDMASYGLIHHNRRHVPLSVICISSVTWWISTCTSRAHPS